MTEKSELRDMRKTDWFWSDSVILKARIPSSIKLVYFGLCSFANGKEQQCFPSLDTLATIAGLSKRSVIRSLNQLERARIVSIKRSPGRGRSNIYTLLKVKGANLSLFIKGDISLHKKVTKTTLKGDTTAPLTSINKQTKEQALIKKRVTVASGWREIVRQKGIPV